MHRTALFLLMICSVCLAHYRVGYDTKNLIVREEPENERLGDIIECPVCKETGWMPSNEECPIVLNGKTYKKCELGTYVNEICGSKLDCYRGPGEQCTEKRDPDIFGQKCAPGFYCNNALGICTGIGFSVDTIRQYVIDPSPYTDRISFNGKHLENPFIRLN